MDKSHKGYHFSAVAEHDAAKAQWRGTLLILERKQIVWREIVAWEPSAFRALNAAVIAGPALIDRLLDSGLI